MSDLIEKLSNLRSQFNCFDENERDAYHTLSEAIKVLSEQPELCEDAVYRADVVDMLDMYTFTEYGEYETAREIVKRLPSVTLKPDHIGDATEMVEYDDCVSRQAVADVAYEVGNLFDGEDDTRTPYGVAFDIQMAVDKLPSVTPKRKTGKWIEYDSDEDKYDLIKCPCCKHTFTVDAYHWTDIGFVKDDFKFCPNCGSKNGDARNE